MLDPMIILAIAIGTFVAVAGVIGAIVCILCCCDKIGDRAGQKRDFADAEQRRDIDEFKRKAVFSVQFDSPNDVFTPGSEVSGTVTLTVKEPVEAKSIDIEFHGEANTDWIDIHKYSSQGFVMNGEYHHNYGGSYTDFATYNSNTSYVDSIAKVWTPPNGQSTDFIPAGIYRFPFRITLPVNCPPSFEGENCSVRYYCKATIDRPDGKNNVPATAMFKVIPIIDLNLIPEANSPYQMDVEQALGIFKSGKIEMKVKMLKRGVILGENIVLEILIGNFSKKAITRMEVTVVQRVRITGELDEDMFYNKCEKSSAKTKYTNLVASDEKVWIEKGATEKLTRSLLIPHGTVATISNCNIINVDYSVLIEFPSEVSPKPIVEARLPLIIGTIPIRQASVPSESMSQNETQSIVTQS